MIIEPRVRGFICTTAHPKGCEKAVQNQIDYVKKQGKFAGPKNVLVIGASTGYGLATRIASAFGSGAKTIGVFYEKEAQGNKTASAGWYNTAAFEKFANAEGLYAKSVNGDAFSHAIKRQTLDLIKKDLGKVDLVVYSLASPKRVHPDSGDVYSSVLKPIGKPYNNKTVDPIREEVKTVYIEPANEEEINNTIAVMGGDDWQMWIDLLLEEKLLAEGAQTIGYTYLGPEMTYDIYKKGTIGRAKDHLLASSYELNEKLASTVAGSAYLSVNKALVTQASAAIPVVPLYISILYKIMKEQGTHEGCIEQMYRMMSDKIYGTKGVLLDPAGMVRMDDWEMAPDVQKAIIEIWPKVDTENLRALTDIQGYQDDFYQLFGFRQQSIDYAVDVNPDVKIASVESEIPA